MAEHDGGYKLLFSHPEMVADLLRDFPELADLEEIKSMLADRVMEWTQQWKQEGLEEGIQKGRQKGQEDALEKARGVLLRDLAGRFGSLSEEVRQRVGAIGSIEELMEFTLRTGAASSLDALPR